MSTKYTIGDILVYHATLYPAGDEYLLIESIEGGLYHYRNLTRDTTGRSHVFFLDTDNYTERVG